MSYIAEMHPQFEYALYVRVKNATPYISPFITDDINLVFRQIEDIEKKHNRYNQAFYIDNDFYNNEYSKAENGVYYKFLVRKVNDWHDLKLQQEKKVLKFVR